MSAVPAKSRLRTLAQRERILAAAQQCFIEHGFHAASMASIAATAAMSPGLIYRYFSGKNEIIVAIIERQLELLRSELAQLDGSVDLAARLAENYGQCRSTTAGGLNPALVLEMSAEATRDPKIAAALANFDTALRTEVADWLSRSAKYGGPGLPPAKARARALILQCIIDGLKVRQTREPDLDRKQLGRALAEILQVLLAPVTATSCETESKNQASV